MRANLFIFIFALIVLMSWPTQTAQACSCISSGPPCQAYWASNTIFSGRVTEVASFTPDDGPLKGYSQKLFRLTVIKPYRGMSETTVEVITGMGGGDCGYPFKVDESYLVYAYRSPKDNKLHASICSRTRPLSEAAEDLDYIESLQKAEAGGMIYGVINTFRRVNADIPVQSLGPMAGAGITIEGSNKSFEVVTDARGEFRITSLPPGGYSVRLKTPEGMWPAINERKVEVQDKGCAFVNFSLERNTSLSGRVLDENGQPAPKIMVDLVLADQIGQRYQKGYHSVFTDEEGRFNFHSLPAGEYYLGVRLGRIGEPSFPYPRTLYPGTQEPAQAHVIKISEGQSLEGYSLQLPPKLTPRRIEGIVVWPDGKPVSNAGICFEEVEYSEGALCFGGDVKIGEDGRFSFTGWEGLRYLVRATVSVGGSGSGQRHAEPVEVPAKGNINNLKLVVTEPNGTCPKCLRWKRGSR